MSTELSVIENNGKLEVKDPETGQKMSFTQTDVARLSFCEMQVGMGLHVIATSLKTIRDEKLYLVRGYKTMAEYAYDNMNMGNRTMRNYIRLADSFSDAEKVKAISEVGITKAMQLIKDPDFVETAEQANNEELRELIHGRLAKIEKQNKRIKEENKRLKQGLSDEKEAIQSITSKYDELKDQVDQGKYEPITSKKKLDAGLKEFQTSIEKFSNLLSRSDVFPDLDIVTMETSIYSKLSKLIELLEPDAKKRYVELKKSEESSNIQDAEVVGE